MAFESASDARGRNTRIEQIEIESWADMCRAASEKTKTKLGIGAVKVGSALAAVTSQIDTLALNRLMGAGLAEPIDDRIIAETIRIYRDAGVPRFFIQPSPDGFNAEVERHLEQGGLRYYNNWDILYRGAESPPEVDSRVAVRQIDQSQAEIFADIIISAFEWNDDLGLWMIDIVGRENWYHYLAYEGDKAIAAASMYARRKSGWIGFAATLPGNRGKGAQSSLIAERIKKAGQLGCDLLVVETAQDLPDKPSPSNRNIRRFGFKQAYLRPNYIYKFE